MRAEQKTSSRPQNNHYVLIVEDSSVDFEIISRAFKRVEFSPEIHHCVDGDEALGFLLNAANNTSGYSFPTLVLLDLNLPGTDGRQVLLKMKEDATMKKIPIIILSTSHNENDIDFCFSHGANKYLKKPISLDEYADTAKTIKSFWEDQIISHVSTFDHQ